MLIYLGASVFPWKWRCVVFRCVVLPEGRSSAPRRPWPRRGGPTATLQRGPCRQTPSVRSAVWPRRENAEPPSSWAWSWRPSSWPGSRSSCCTSWRPCAQSATSPPRVSPRPSGSDTAIPRSTPSYTPYSTEIFGELSKRFCWSRNIGEICCLPHNSQKTKCLYIHSVTYFLPPLFKETPHFKLEEMYKYWGISFSIFSFLYYFVASVMLCYCWQVKGTGGKDGLSSKNTFVLPRQMKHNWIECYSNRWHEKNFSDKILTLYPVYPPVDQIIN